MCKHEAQFWKQSFLFPTTQSSAVNSREQRSELNIIQQSEDSPILTSKHHKIGNNMSHLFRKTKTKKSHIFCTLIGDLEPSVLCFAAFIKKKEKCQTLQCMVQKKPRLCSTTATTTVLPAEGAERKPRSRHTCVSSSARVIAK